MYLVIPAAALALAVIVIVVSSCICCRQMKNIAVPPMPQGMLPTIGHHRRVVASLSRSRSSRLTVHFFNFNFSRDGTVRHYDAAEIRRRRRQRADGYVRNGPRSRSCGYAERDDGSRSQHHGDLESERGTEGDFTPDDNVLITITRLLSNESRVTHEMSHKPHFFNDTFQNRPLPIPTEATDKATGHFYDSAQ